MSTKEMRVLGEDAWHARRSAHVARVDEWVAGHRERRGRGQHHPVEDFLFEYYSQRPGRLRRWHPGYEVALAGRSAEEFLQQRDYARLAGGVGVDVPAVLASRGDTIRWVQNLLRRTTARAPQFGCFGLHEWAMVYRLSQDQIRHPEWPLRMSPEEIATVVEDRGVRCSHFDAFRFFAPEAKPLNLIQLSRADQPDREQPGCLHANMDLYKWAYKMSPLVPSELVADCFELAREIRELDMRASPYDLTSLDYSPVRIETPEGRADYAAAQRGFADRAEPLRLALVRLSDELLAI